MVTGAAGGTAAGRLRRAGRAVPALGVGAAGAAAGAVSAGAGRRAGAGAAAAAGAGAGERSAGDGGGGAGATLQRAAPGQWRRCRAVRTGRAGRHRAGFLPKLSKLRNFHRK